MLRVACAIERAEGRWKESKHQCGVGVVVYTHTTQGHCRHIHFFSLISFFMAAILSEAWVASLQEERLALFRE